jgi:hypothetical protein
MIYSVFAQLDDGTVLLVASCDDPEQAVQIVETLNASWPRRYVVRDSIGNDVYVNEQPPN